MKCISLWQPWASLMAIGAKRIETRSWPTNHCGLLAIHAAKKPISQVPGLLEAIRKDWPAWSGAFDGHAPIDHERHIIGFGGLPFGAIVAVVKVYDCWRVERIERADANATPELDARVAATLRQAGHSEAVIADALKPSLTPQERAFGDYSAERFGWLTEPSLRKQLREPVPCVGRQGMFNLPADVERAVLAQIGATP